MGGEAREEKNGRAREEQKVGEKEEKGKNNNIEKEAWVSY